MSGRGGLANPYRTHIIVHPIMTGGIVPEETQRALLEDGWARVGYAACFDCIEGRSSLVAKPPVRDFLAEVASFFGGDVAEHTCGCRAAQFAVMATIAQWVKRDGAGEYGNVVVTDSLCHYTTALAAEGNDLQLVEVPHGGYPEYRVSSDGFAQKIEEVKRRTGKLPGLVALTHVEPYYGNVNPASEVGKIAEEYGVPYMVNAAYTGGVMPVNMREFRANFLTLSAHKSMASMGPLGFLVTDYGWAKRVFRESGLVTDWSGRTFGKKLPSLFGCSVGGIPLVSAMYSFPRVVERVKEWEGELEKVRWFVREMEELDGIMLIGERPHRHHLMHLETPIFWELSKRHRRRGFFLAEEMVKRGIVGLHRGMSKHVKLSTYGLSWEEVRKVRDSFHEVAGQKPG